HFREESLPTLIRLIQEAQTGNLVSYSHQSGLLATNLPWIVDSVPTTESEGDETLKIRLLGHIAKANPHWKEFADHNSSSDSSLVIFQTPANAYVSPSWYPTKQEHGKHVPTWNYEAVHVYGRVEIVHDRDSLHEIVTRLTDHHETKRTSSWKVSDAPEGYINTMLKSIVGVVIHVERLEGKRKLSQNMAEKNFEGVYEATKAADDAGERAMAKAMAEVRIKK
ncbi:hypothetical protein HDU93_003038, partial [Gonapodya sp. JEL0774]